MSTVTQQAVAARWRRLALALGVAALALPGAAPAAAQESLTGVILRGRAMPGQPASGATALTPGLRVESPAGTWTEIAFSDGSSVVLEPGADFTLRGMERDGRSGRLVVRAASGRGRLRVSTSDRVDIAIATPGAEVRVSGASAVIEAGPQGSATLTSGRSVTVRRADGQEEVIRRAGFSLAFGGGTRRQSREQLAEAVAPFAPVTSTRQARRGEQVELAEDPDAAGRAARDPYARQRSETVAYPTVALGPAGPTPQPPPPPPLPPPGEPGQRNPGSLSLAGAVFAAGAARGAGFGAPGVNSSTSRLDGSVASNGAPDPVTELGIVGLPLTEFRTTGSSAANPVLVPGRVRRFAAEASGRLPNRVDTGTLSGSPASSLVTSPANFRNLVGNALPTGSAEQFFDGTARIGIVEVTTFSGTPANPDFQQSLISPRISVSDAVTPSTIPSCLTTGAPGACPTNVTDPENPNGAPRTRVDARRSAVLEVPLVPGSPGTPRDGTVVRLSGPNGLMVISAEAELPRARTGTGFLVGGPSGPAAAATLPVGVFIVDKITESNAEIAGERGIQPGERYFVIGGTPLPPPANGGLPGPAGAPLAAGTVTRFAVSDGLNPLGGFVEGQRIEAQFRQPGDPGQIAAFARFNAFRPEETFVPGAPRGDTHLLAIAGTGNRNPALRTDLQVAPDGRTSASVAVGGFASLPGNAASLALSGNVVGSSRAGSPGGTAADALGQGSVGIASALGSLGTDAPGTGAHLFGGSALAPGQVGYFAVGQADTRRGAPGGDGGQPGTLSRIGTGTSDGFAFTRLATNVGPPAAAIPPGPLDDLRGFAAGLVEATTPGAAGVSLHAAVGASLGDVAIQGRGGSQVAGRRADRELDAAIRLAPRAPGEISEVAPAAAPPAGRATRTLVFGQDGGSGQPPTTAVASPATFAAVRPGQAAMASVDADLLRGIRRPDGTPAALPPSNEHLAWGYFLGDLVAQANGGGREFANLGFWVAGRPVDFGTLQTLTGVATYTGGMIGNAADARGLRTVAGDFSHRFDFGARQGRMDAAFDGARFGIGTGMANGSGVFAGSGAGTLDRTLSVQGAFFHGAAGGALAAGNLPRATGGVFGIAGSGYGANGIFVGARP